MKIIGFIVVLITGTILLYGTQTFPKWSDPTSPASSHLSPHFIKNALEETAVPNLVTAVLADYRGYDTMFETAVIFAAGLACFFLLRTFKRKKSSSKLYRHLSTGIIINVDQGGKMRGSEAHFEQIDSHWTPNDLIIKTTCRFIIPFMAAS